MAINWSKLRDGNSYSEFSFPLSFGVKKDNEMFKVVRHAWENQSVDVHQRTLHKIMNELLKFKVELNPLGHISHVTIRTGGNYVEPVKIVKNVETHLVDFDMLSNSDFSGLDDTRISTPINPKSYSGSPVIVKFHCFNVTNDDYHLMKDKGFFFARGEGEIDYVHQFDVSMMNDIHYGVVTEFKVDSLCWLNYVDGSEQVLYKV